LVSIKGKGENFFAKEGGEVLENKGTWKRRMRIHPDGKRCDLPFRKREKICEKGGKGGKGIDGTDGKKSASAS